MNSPVPKQDNMIPRIKGLRKIADQYDLFLIDVWGVLHNGIKPYAGTLQCLTELKSAGKQTCLISNTPRRSESLKEQMEDIGIDAALYDHVMTAGESANFALLKRSDDFHHGCGKTCFFMGEGYMESVMDGLDLDLADKITDADFVLNGLGGTQESDHDHYYRLLDQALIYDLPMVCANPDIVVNVGDNQFACAGMFARYYEEKGGRVAYHGKPHKEIYEACWTLSGKPDKSRILAIGDSLHTDIQGANRFGVDSVFNLVGIHQEEVWLENKPGEVDIDKVHKMVDSQPHKPDFVMCGFEW